jgi:hypothetical protein
MGDTQHELQKLNHVKRRALGREALGRSLQCYAAGPFPVLGKVVAPRLLAREGDRAGLPMLSDAGRKPHSARAGTKPASKNEPQKLLRGIYSAQQIERSQPRACAGSARQYSLSLSQDLLRRRNRRNVCGSKVRSRCESTRYFRSFWRETSS